MPLFLSRLLSFSFLSAAALLFGGWLLFAGWQLGAWLRPAEAIGGEPVIVEPVERFGPAEKLTKLDASVTESSGLAASRTRPGWLWTHNDSAGGTWLTRFAPSDGEAQRFRVAGVANYDWEDMVSFEREGQSWLLVADTGDNMRKRMSVSIHLIAEPAADADPDEVLVVTRTLRLTYADGPRDCEAVAVDPSGDVAWLVSKEITARGKVFGQAGLYRLPLTWPAASQPEEAPPSIAEPVVLKRLATLDTVMPTAMDISPDGRFAMIATYAGGLLYERPAGASWDQVMAESPPMRITLPPRRQGEGLCFSVEGSAVFLSSEKPEQPVWRLAFDGR